MDKTLSNNEIIIKYIIDNQGCHLRELKRDLKLSMGSTQYHLDRLEKDGKITSVRNGLYKYYFSIGTDQKEKSLIQVLKNETSREIIQYILNNKNPTQTDIALFLNLSTPSIHSQLKRLLEFNIIEETKDGKFKRYHVKNKTDYYSVLSKILRDQKDSIWNKWSDRLAEMFTTIAGENEKFR